VKLNTRPPDLDFQPRKSHRSSLSGAIALLEMLTNELCRSDPNSSIWLLTKVAEQLLRRIEAGGIVEEAEWVESFVRAQNLFEFIRTVTSLFETKKGVQANEQTVSRQN